MSAKPHMRPQLWGGGPRFPSLEAEVAYFRDEVGFDDVHVVNTPALGIEVTVSHRNLPHDTRLHVFVRADPALGLTCTRLQPSGEMTPDFPEIEIQEGLDTTALVPLIKFGPEHQVPWVDLYAQAHFVDKPMYSGLRRD